MYLRRTQSNCGRHVSRPQNCEDVEELVVDEVIEDQIEHLRTKIQLKERYNRVIKEELDESKQGASSILYDLYDETKELREKLVKAINSEKTAVRNALRTHREFQLAMRDKTPAFAIPWLEDKLFDVSKRLNIYLSRLQCKRICLEEAENMVIAIEKWPRPGTSPWEMQAYKTFFRIENEIENVRGTLETANIIHSKLYEIKYILREEKGKYAPLLQNLDNQIHALQIELVGMQKILDDAIYFRGEAIKNLAITEKEASDNRKRRRRQMAKMKKAVQIVLDTNHLARAPEIIRKTYLEQGDVDHARMEFLGRIAAKREEVEKYQDRARQLVEAMRVPDLTHIPGRFRRVMELGIILQEEQESKQQFRDLLLRQKDQLYLIMCYFSYTGVKTEKEYTDRVKEYEDSMVVSNQDVRDAKLRLHRYGNIIVDLRLAAITILSRIDEGRKREYLRRDFYNTVKTLQTKVKRLVLQVQSLQGMLPEPAAKNYASYIRNPPIPARLVRVGSPVISEDTDEDEIIDMKVPTRADIKAKSARIVQQGMLRRGYR